MGSSDRKFTYRMSCIVVSTELSSTSSMMEISDYTYHDDDDHDDDDDSDDDDDVDYHNDDDDSDDDDSVDE